MTRTETHIIATGIAAALAAAGCGPTATFKPDNPSDVRKPVAAGDVKVLEEDQSPGPGYKTIGMIEVSSELTCNTAMTQSKEGAKEITDAYVKSHMDLADASPQEVVEAMIENGDLTKGQACKVLPIFSQIPEKEEVMIAVLEDINSDALVQGTGEAGGEALFEVDHQVFKTRKKPPLSGAGAVPPALVVNVKSSGKVITLKPEKAEKKAEKKASSPKKTEEIIVVTKKEPEVETEAEEPAAAATAGTAATAPAGKKAETVVVKTEGEPAKKKEEPKLVTEPKPAAPVEEKKTPSDPTEAAIVSAEEAKKAAEDAEASLKEAKKKAAEAKKAAEDADKAKKVAIMKKKKEEEEALKKAQADAKKAAALDKKKAEEEAAKKKAEEEAAKKKAEEEAKKPPEPKPPEPVEAPQVTEEMIDQAKDIIRSWRKEIFACLHKSQAVEDAGKVGLTFFIDTEGKLDGMNVSPEPGSETQGCLQKTIGDLDFPEAGVMYQFTMKYKVEPE